MAHGLAEKGKAAESAQRPETNSSASLEGSRGHRASQFTPLQEGSHPASPSFKHYRQPLLEETALALRAMFHPLTIGKFFHAQISAYLLKNGRWMVEGGEEEEVVGKTQLHSLNK